MPVRGQGNVKPDPPARAVSSGSLAPNVPQEQHPTHETTGPSHQTLKMKGARTSMN